ncbi:MAG: hypothetical protein IPJ65_06720 [Archangiaceae bacterium]|nr:hypothetical protein [Archangiaceae bacterium]
MTVRALLLLLLLLACGPAAEPGVTVVTTPALEPLMTSSVEFVGGDRRVATAADPQLEARARAGFTIAVVARDDCTECYRLEGEGKHLTVHGGVPLGVQYGLAHAFELYGYGFFHPWQGRVPKEPLEASNVPTTELAPEVDQRRGLHLHTLHPIEAYYDFWENGESNLEGARRTVDFMVKNRGNYVQ